MRQTRTCDHVFPTVSWDGSVVTFHPVEMPEPLGTPFAVVVFAMRDGSFILADIPGRGWITPSGRLELGESSCAAAVRETWEEIGAALEDVVEIGHYEITPPSAAKQYATAFVGRVGDFGSIPAGSESRGARTATLEELPSLYWRWDPLLEAVFRFAANR